ncbi:DUF5979 domain-containing protein [Agromyces seonyuensis]|nr:DUF5979 domain-containing protein [Agromyces seonyuensis]
MDGGSVGARSEKPADGAKWGLRAIGRAASVVGAIALVAGLGVVASPTTPPSAWAAYPGTFNPLAMNGGFTVYAREDLVLGNTETEGSLAAGDAATYQGGGQYEIIHVATGTSDYTIPSVDGDPTRLLVGQYAPSSNGILAITSAGTTDPALQGDLKMVQRDGPWQGSDRAGWLRVNPDATQPDLAPIIDATAQIYPDGLTPPAAGVGAGSIYTADTSPDAVAGYVEANAEADYEQAADCLDGLVDGPGYPVGVAENDGDRVVLEPLSPDQPNVVDYDDIAGATDIQFSPDGPTPGAANPLIIQVPAGTTHVDGARADPVGAYAAYMFWDLSQVTGDVEVVSGGRIDGSIYAPNANLTVQASPLDGQVLGQNVVLEGGEVHSFIFAGTISCDADSGTFEVAKALSGIAPDDLPAGSTFTVNYTATEPDGTTVEGSLEVPADGTAVGAGEQFPIGTVVDFGEVTPATVPGYDWTDVAIDPDEITIGAGTASVVVTNTAEAIPEGGFAVSKAVDDAGVPVTGLAGTVTVDWVAVLDGAPVGAGTLDVPLDGTAVGPPGTFPEGTRIVLIEVRSSLPDIDGYRWSGTGWSPGRTFVIQGDATAQITVTNSVVPDTAPRTITIVKHAEGEATDPGYVYSLQYRDDPADPYTAVALPLDTPVTLAVDPAATTLELIEDPPTLDGSAVDTSAWDVPVLSWTDASGAPVQEDAPFGEAVDVPLEDGVDLALEIENSLLEGTFSISKEFAGIDPALVPAGLAFTVTWTATTPSGQVQDGVLRVPADGTAVGPVNGAGEPIPFPYGTEIVFDEAPAPGVNWLEWGEPVFDPVPLVIGAGGADAVSATVTNTAALRTATFQVDKRLIGIDQSELLTDSFTVDWTARTPAGTVSTGSFEVPADGTPAGPGVEFPLGTLVFVEEEPLEAADLPPNYRWVPTGWHPSAWVLIGADETPELTVTNAVVRLARFSVEKEVDGPAAGAVPPGTVFPIDWWLADQPQTPLDAQVGTPVLSPWIPVGRMVQLSEAEPPAVDGATWTAQDWSVDGTPVEPGENGRVSIRVVGDADPAVAFTVVNTLVPIPIPIPTPTPTPTPSPGTLPDTGAGFAPLTLVGGLAIALAGLALLLVDRLRRRRRA